MAIGPVLALLCATCIAVVAAPGNAYAQSQSRPQSFSIPAGSLKRALDLYAQQVGTELIYRSEEVAYARSPGAAGTMPPNAALSALLANSGFKAQRDPSGAIAIVRNRPVPVVRSRPPASGPGPEGSAAVTPAARPAAPDVPGEIIVTARKRQESILKVPVVETVIAQEKLEAYQINDLTRLTSLVPGLLIGNGTLAIGPQVSVRGVGTTTQDAGVDQSVSLNLDGLPIGQGLAYRAGLFDVANVEIIKGPQTLFYGKNNIGGVISLRTSDPGSEVEIIARTAYEFEADEVRGELILSAPVTDTFGIRVAGMTSDMEGFFRNKAVAAPGTGALDPKYKRFDNSHSTIVRGTMLLRPSSKFDARLKVNYTREQVQGNSAHNQLRSCPDGTGAVAPTDILFLSPLDDCKLDRVAYWVDMDPAAFPGIRNQGVPFLDTRQRFGTLEMNYRFLPDLKLTSVTGYYHLKADVFINSSQAGFAAPLFATDNSFRRRDFTQEFRLDSDFDAPVNVTLGAFYQDAELAMLVSRSINVSSPAVVPALRTRGTHDVDIKSYSLFGQVRWKPVPQVEIAGGVRWVDEKRHEAHFNLISGTPVRIPLAVDRIRARDWSPEFTITYTPTEDLTLFGSVKQGYKSGSFTLTQVFSPGFNNSFGDEKVQGGEIGLKSRLLDRALMLNLAAYLYKYKGLQVGTTETNPETGLPIARTLNAGGARIYGVDFDFIYRPPAIRGLTLNGAAGWTHARFTDLHGIPCWGGQRIQDGCDEFLHPVTGRFTAQGLDGLRMVRAPDWQIQAGVSYEMPVGSRTRLAFGVDGQYTSKFPTTLSRRKDTIMKGFALFSANAALRSSDDAWEVALIGTNLGNKINFASCTQANFQNGSVGPGIISGAGTRGPAGIDEVMCTAKRGREIWVRLTVRPTTLFAR